jgi:ubiquinone/menaquinone biosynthesis C-methylase UbiE
MKQHPFRILAAAIIGLTFSFIISSAAAQTSARDAWQQPEKIMDSLGIRRGMIVGEAGAGDGYFTFHLAKRVGDEGKVIANDIDKRALQRLFDRCTREHVQNIDTLLGKIDDPLFPSGALDCVVMMMAFHDFEKPVEWMKNVAPALKPGAFLAIIDQDPDKTKRDRGHFWTKEKVLATMEKTEFELVRLFTFLERDNIYMYRLKEGR